MGQESYDDATRRGFEAFDRGDLETSYEAFDNAYALASNDAERAAAQLQIAYRLQSLGHDERSREAATKALAGFRSVADRPKATRAEIFMAKMNIGWCFGVLNDLEGAVAAFRDTLSVSGSPVQTADIHKWIGYHLKGLERHDEAHEHYRQSAEWFRRAVEEGGLSREDEAECLWGLAGAHHIVGEYRDAKDALDRMLAIPEANPAFVRDAQPMLEELTAHFPESPTSSPASDAREVICGMDGDIHWRPVLPASGLDGLETEGVWERDGDSLLVRSKDGSASLTFGEESWEDCEFDVHVTPLEGGNAEVVVRSSFMGAYVLDLMLGWQAAQVSRRRSYGFERLSVVDFSLVHGQEYHVRVAARGGSITSYIDGQLVNQTTDFEMKRGKLGLHASNSVTRYRAPRYRVL